MNREALQRLLSYNPETGEFRWLVNVGNIKAGSVAGCSNGKGHIIIRVNREKHYAHRLAWLFTYGEFPSSILDHINQDGMDNRIENLRIANHSLNAVNSKRFVAVEGKRTGVSRRYGRWRALIQENGKRKHLGDFDSFEDAVAAREVAERSLYGEFVPQQGSLFA